MCSEAWFVLNRVPDGSGGEAPQYLVAGARSGEGQACDFTLLRVYTWSTARMRYETAAISKAICVVARPSKFPVVRRARIPFCRGRRGSGGAGKNPTSTRTDLGPAGKGQIFKWGPG